MSNAKKHLKTLCCTSAAVAITVVAPIDMGLVGVSTANAQNIIKVKRNGQGSERVVLGLNKSIVLDLPEDAYDILVANPGVADAVTRTKRRIYLFGKEVGETNIFVFDKAGNQVVSLDLRVERDVAGLDRYLTRFVQGSDIKTEIINDNIVLTGTVQTPQDSAKAAKLAEIFVRGGNATGDSSGFSFFRRNTSQIVNLLDIAGGDQITLKVTVAEVQRSVMKQLGINLLGSRTGGSGITFNGISQNVAGALGKALSPSGFSLGGAVGGLNLDAYFRAMEEAGVMKTLSSPTLTAISGESAKFFAGGTYNLVAGSAPDGNDGGVTYTFKEVDFGVGLEFTPVVLSPGRISLKIKTEVSEPTSEGSQALSAGVQSPSTNILSIRRREADTTVELPSGGSMMIAGLIRDDVRQVVTGFPGLSKLPVLGALFRSRDFVRNESELVIMVTPYLVRPVAASQIALPTDNLTPPSDAAGNLLGRVNRIYGSVDQKLPQGRYHGAVGFIYK